MICNFDGENDIGDMSETPQLIFQSQSIITLSEILVGGVSYISPISFSPSKLHIIYFERITKTLLPSPHNQSFWFWTNIILFGVKGNKMWQAFWFLSQVSTTFSSRDTLIGQLSQLTQLSRKLWALECSMLYKIVCIDNTNILVFVPGLYDLPFSR